MKDLLSCDGKVLEIGSGCGYQSAVLSHFANEVFAIERIKPLVQKSRDNMTKLKINNVIFKFGDGYQDWDDSIKYDGILCAASPREYPKDLISILKKDAKLVSQEEWKGQNLLGKCLMKVRNVLSLLEQ